jgi:hypothetical protein
MPYLCGSGNAGIFATSVPICSGRTQEYDLVPRFWQHRLYVVIGSERGYFCEARSDHGASTHSHHLWALQG